MPDSGAFWAQVKDQFGFPDYVGNWDAFYDSFADSSLPPRLAVVWRHANEAASSNLKLFAEAMAWPARRVHTA
jgi:RNAse (barnase) inhibitor barstar